MKIVFVDTNVVLDFLMDREGSDEAQAILNLAESHKIKIGYSFLLVANTAYVVRHGHTREEVDEIISSLCNVVDVLSMDKQQLRKALINPALDFEDDLQYQCAKAHGYELIITKNTKHFPFHDIVVLTPKEFLETIS